MAYPYHPLVIEQLLNRITDNHYIFIIVINFVEFNVNRIQFHLIFLLKFLVINSNGDFLKKAL